MLITRNNAAAHPTDLGPVSAQRADARCCATAREAFAGLSPANEPAQHEHAARRDPASSTRTRPAPLRLQPHHSAATRTTKTNTAAANRNGRDRGHRESIPVALRYREKSQQRTERGQRARRELRVGHHQTAEQQERERRRPAGRRWPAQRTIRTGCRQPGHRKCEHRASPQDAPRSPRSSASASAGTKSSGW